MTAHDKLLAHLEDVQAADPSAIPCRGPDGDRWISGTPKDTWAAVAGCEQCPAKSACASYAIHAEEAAGVWGGTTPKQRAATAKTRRALEPKPLTDSEEVA